MKYWSIAWRFFIITFAVLAVILYTFQLGLEKGYQFGWNTASQQCMKTNYGETGYSYLASGYRNSASQGLRVGIVETERSN